MPLSGKTADIPLARKKIGVAFDSLQIFNGSIGCLFSAAALYPIVDPVLRGDGSGKDRGSCGRTDGRCTEEVLESDSAFCKSVDIRRADLAVAVTAKRSIALIVGKDQYYIRFLFHIGIFLCWVM